MSEIISAKGLCKQFLMGTQSVPVLDHIDLSIEKGEFVSIMGPSGCGKSTLLYLLGGLDKPSGGEVLMNGKNIAAMNDKEKSILRRNSLGFVFQFYNLVQNLTVEENILLPIVMDGKKAADYKARLHQILKTVGLADRAHFTPRELSGGQQQRVAIARSLIANPELILADEPIGNLDSKSGTEIMELFRRINAEHGNTIIQVTHSQEAAQYGTKTVHMRDGKIDLVS